MQIISKFATIAIPRMWHAGGISAIVAAVGGKVLVVKEMLNYQIGGIFGKVRKEAWKYHEGDSRKN
ncbi:hypothetical protein [Chitinophaga sp. LS1]|uniref:hypothetical protein n=1 Tax=Chitinophaga sp. LS1 TaxID=3051176 RepID=UPI002AAA9989|nr:hypothetical protein [Chitinophaga sp. LS1]WPV64226.1 hypothetical protein QQL36_20705 [Chitinophaga sp. LS1]